MTADLYAYVSSNPLAARDVPIGSSWLFDHRTMREILEEESAAPKRRGRVRRSPVGKELVILLRRRRDLGRLVERLRVRAAELRARVAHHPLDDYAAALLRMISARSLALGGEIDAVDFAIRRMRKPSAGAGA